MTRFGTFDRLLADTATPMRPVLARLRQLVLDIHPETVEVVRLGERAATYGLGPRKMSEAYVYILPHAKWVNLGFFHGASLADPAHLLEGTGAAMRHAKVRSLEQATAAATRLLIEAALAERRGALGFEA